MSKLLIAVCGVIYLGISIDQGIKHNFSIAVTYFGYALGNVGLYMAAT